MKALVIDTNVLIALFKGDKGVADVVSDYERILIPTIVLGEFKAGVVLDSRNGPIQRRILDQFLDAPSVEVVPITEEISDTYALVFKALREKGTPIPQNDMWIAAVALAANASLITRDTHFENVPLLKCAYGM